MTGPRASSLPGSLILRPYGSGALGVSGAFWTLAAAVLVYLLAGTVAAVVAYAVAGSLPDGGHWTLAVAIALGAIVFAIVWLLAASLLMSTRPSSALQPGRSPGRRAGLAVWVLGIVARLAAISFFIAVATAWVELTLHRDDLDRELAQRRDAVLDAYVAQRLGPLEADLDRSTSDRRSASAELDALWAGREAVTRDLEAATGSILASIADWERVAERELNGAAGIAAGKGPRYARAIKEIDRLQADLSRTMRARNSLADPFDRRIKEYQKKLWELTAREERLKNAIATLIKEGRTPAQDGLAEPPAPETTLDSLLWRLQALTEVQKGRADSNILAPSSLLYAVSGYVFYAILFLKLLAPRGIGFYYNEDIQRAWQRYRRGAFRGKSGYPDPDGPESLDYAGFADTFLRGEGRETRGLAAAPSRLADLLRTHREIVGKRSLRT